MIIAKREKHKLYTAIFCYSCPISEKIIYMSNLTTLLQMLLENKAYYLKTKLELIKI